MSADTPFGMPELPSDWIWMILDELSERVSVGHVGETSSVFCGKEGVIFLRSQNVRPGKVELNDVKFVTKEFHEKSKKSQLKAGDILIVRVGQNRGDCAVVPEGLGELNCANIVFSRPNKKYSEFLGYFFNSSFGRAALLAVSTGSAQGVLNTKSIAKVPIPVPPEDVAENIGKYLKALDNKIELNHQINQTLESIAQTIFKSWFVDFAPVKAKIAAIEAGEDAEGVTCAAMRAISGKTDDELDQMQAGPPENYAQLKTTAGLFPSAMQDSELGEVPEGWEVGVLSDLIEFNPKRALKKGIVTLYLDMKNVPTAGHLADEVILREMKSGTKFINGDTLLARITPCLENGKTAYVDFLSDGQVGWGSTEYIVMRPKNAIPASFGYFVARLDSFRQFAIQSMTGTSGRQRANADALKALPWIKFPTEIIQAFDKIGGATLEQAKSRGDENKTLAQLRDTLLPKLLYGELSVDAIEMARGKMKE